MRLLRNLTLIFALGGLTVHAAQQDAQPAGAAPPIPKLDADGPTSFVTALAFSPDGQTLYSAGWDKIIRVWRRDARGPFQLDTAATFRVPIGPGPAGMLNAIAVSPNGRWLAAGGNATFRHGSTFDRPGLVVPALGAMDQSMREDQGAIYLFDTRTREVRQLRGHQGAVVALEFAENDLLVSAGQQWDDTGKVRRGAVRIWNAATGKALAVTNVLPEPKTRPALAAVQAAAAGRLPTIAIAWGEDRLWIWNAATNQVHATADGRYNNTVTNIEGTGVVTGSARGLTSWSIGQTAQVRSRFEQALNRTIPRAMASASLRGDGRFDTLAIVSREPGSEQDRLYLVDPRRGQLLAQPANLWNGRGTQPALAASRTGDVAVTGGRSHQIVIHAIADLRQNRIAPRQVLDSSGEAVRVAAIARKGDEYGLVLSGTAKQQPGQVRARLLENDRVFDVSRGAFAADRRGWTMAAPAESGWSVRHETRGAAATQRTAVIVTSAGRAASEILLEPRQQLSDYALLPPRAQGERPLLAIAYFDFENGQPVLALFDAAAGDRFREYLGHTGRITSVAFSADGRLLATAAEDQTVCVWTLSDLDQVLGVRGQLTGLKIDARQAEGERLQIVVAEAARHLIDAGLSPGDVLEGIVLGERVQPFDSPRTLYEALSLVKPGAKVTLRRLRGNNRADVEVVAGQGIDERKPLFTFYASRTAADGAAQWIGWSPLGPFDSSGESIQRLLGWHFNTGQAEAPVSFASVDQYRDRFATDGLLQKLLETGRPQLPPERQPEPPLMSLWLHEAGAPPVAIEPGTAHVIRQGPQALEASTSPFPADQVDSIQWRIGEKSGEFLAGEAAWRAELAGVEWTRGRIPVQVTLTTKPPHRELKQVLTLVFQPLPPELKTKLSQRIDSTDQDFEFLAEVVPAGGEAFRAKLTHQHGAAPAAVIHQATSADSLSVREKVRLEPGVNLLTLIAENENAMSERPDNERAAATFEVYYTPPKTAPAPRIELAELVVRTSDGTDETLPVSSAETLVVAAPRVVLRGTVRSAEPLSVAAYRIGTQEEPAPLAGFSPNKSAELKFEQAITLRTGRNRLVLQAQSGKGELAERPLNLDYQPPLPTLAAQPLPGRVFEQKLPVFANLSLPADRQEYQVEVYLNDERLSDDQVEINDERIRTLASLRPGDNRLELRLRNEWGAEPVVQTLGVEYVKPPKIVELTSERQKAPEAVVMKLDVESERRPTAAMVHVNDDPRRVEFEVRQGEQPNRWQMDLKPLPLDPGQNRILVSVSDAESQSEKKELVIAVDKRFEPPPEIVVLSAHDHPVLPDSPVPVEVMVRSTSPIRDLVVEGSDSEGRGKVLHSAADLEKTQKNAQGVYEYLLKTVLDSGSDSKQWRVEAINEAGRKSVEIPNAVIVPPASVFLESVALKSQPDRPLALTKSATGRLMLNQELPESTVILSGYVLAPQSKASQARQIPVQAWVNGFMQKPELAKAVKPGTLRRPFSIEVILSQRQNNLIEVGIVDPEVSNDAANRTTLVLGCSKPNTSRKLHLLIVAVGAKRDEGNQVRDRAIAAVQGKAKNAREFTTPAFEQGVIHGVLLGNTVQRNKVLFEIGRLARNLKTTDVAMIYYQGNVREADDTFYLTTSASKALADPKQTEIGRDELNRWFGKLEGAQLILLDVDRAAAQETQLAGGGVRARWPTDSKIAFFRFAWAAPEAARAPDEQVILTAWEESMRDSGPTLQKIDSGLAEFSAEKKDRFPVVYDKVLPTGLRELNFGAGAPPQRP